MSGSGSAPPPHLAALLAKPTPSPPGPPRSQPPQHRQGPAAPHAHLFVPAQRSAFAQHGSSRPVGQSARSSALPSPARHSTIAIPTPAPTTAKSAPPIAPVAGLSKIAQAPQELPPPAFAVAKPAVQPKAATVLEPERPTRELPKRPPPPPKLVLQPATATNVERALPYSTAKQVVRQEDDDLHYSIEDSDILIVALQRARSRWLTGGILNKFSTSSKAKTAKQISQPPHTVNSLGKATVLAGPLIFAGTKLYEIKWAPGTAAPNSAASKPKAPSNSAAAPRPATPAAPAKGVSPALIARLSTMAATDASLAEILRLAASGRASQVQLQSLARYISALEQQMAPPAPPTPADPSPSPTVAEPPAASPVAPVASQASPTPPPSASTPSATPVVTTTTTTAAPPVASTSTPQPTGPTRPPCLVLEFREAATDRWIIPDLFAIEPASSSSTATKDLLLSFYVLPPTPAPDPRTGRPRPTPPPARLTLRLTELTTTTYEALLAMAKTVSEAKRKARWADFEAKAVAPTYLQLRTPFPPNSAAAKHALEARRLAELKRKGEPLLPPPPKKPSGKTAGGRKRAAVRSALKAPKQGGKKATGKRKEAKVKGRGKDDDPDYGTPVPPDTPPPAEPVAGPSGTANGAPIEGASSIRLVAPPPALPAGLAEAVAATPMEGVEKTSL